MAGAYVLTSDAWEAGEVLRGRAWSFGACRRVRRCAVLAVMAPVAGGRVDGCMEHTYGMPAARRGQDMVSRNPHSG